MPSTAAFPIREARREELEAPPMTPAILVVVGASGAGKTTLVTALEALRVPGVGCYYFDTIGIPSAEETEQRFSGGEGFQGWALEQWLTRLVRNADGVEVAVLDAQVAPSTTRRARAVAGPA